ncbi:hypothetical protein AALP_AAs60910U000500 [Arabis alpina]|uniref:Uncharacterized protein n=1 Tax=Arabis alpina TaxID=50452 RepID=A0A087FYF5_ARAAL|nr:hypothetical protein AALP_AAs60910U000500 [Arabis alpina]
MSNQESEAAPIGSQSKTVEILDKGKHQEDTIVDIPGPSRPNQDPNAHDGVRVKHLTIGVPLYQAALKGDWKAAEAIIDKQNDIVREHITTRSETALHIAVAAKHKVFVRNLLRKMNKNDLALRNEAGNTALCFAAASGVVEIAEMLINMNPDLAMIRGGGGMAPIHMAAMFGHAEMVIYLRGKTDFGELSDAEFMNLFRLTILADIYDEALRMLKMERQLAISKTGTGETALHLMARKPSAISHRRQLNLFQRLANSSK